MDFELYELELGEFSVMPLFKEEREMKAESPITEEKLVDSAESLSAIKTSVVEIMEELEGRKAIDPVDDAIESVKDAIDALYEAVDSIEEEEFDDDEETEEEEEADVEGTEVLNRTVKFGNKEMKEQS